MDNRHLWSDSRIRRKRILSSVPFGRRGPTISLGWACRQCVPVVPRIERHSTPQLSRHACWLDAAQFAPNPCTRWRWWRISLINGNYRHFWRTCAGSCHGDRLQILPKMRITRGKKITIKFLIELGPIGCGVEDVTRKRGRVRIKTGISLQSRFGNT